MSVSWSWASPLWSFSVAPQLEGAKKDLKAVCMQWFWQLVQSSNIFWRLCYFIELTANNMLQQSDNPNLTSLSGTW